jgi:outer membrane protein assembly factor BamB
LPALRGAWSHRLSLPAITQTAGPAPASEPDVERTELLKHTIAIVALLFVAANGVSANDWPGLWGPSRNGTTVAAPDVSRGVAESVWRRPVGGGYSEIVVANGRAFTLELRDGADHIVALDARTGRQQWSVRIGPTYEGHGGSDDGPISTPAVDGNDLFALGPHGQLIAVDVTTGRERWRHDLVRGFSATAPTWGFAASPLIDGQLVIVPTGGAGSRGLLAFDRATGRLRWNAAVGTATGYASAVAGTIAGVRQIVTVASDRVAGVRPTDGQILWSAPGPGGGEVSNSALVLPGDRLLLSNWDESVMLRVEMGAKELAARQLWRSNRLRNANGPTIYRDGHLYGFAGPILLCVDAETQEIKWRERTGAGTLMTVGSRLVLLGDGSGEMVIADVSPEKFTMRHRLRVLSDGVRAVTGASFADGRFYVRNLRELVAVRVM